MNTKFIMALLVMSCLLPVCAKSQTVLLELEATPNSEWVYDDVTNSFYERKITTKNITRAKLLEKGLTAYAELTKYRDLRNKALTEEEAKKVQILMKMENYSDKRYLTLLNE